MISALGISYYISKGMICLKSNFFFQSFFLRELFEYTIDLYPLRTQRTQSQTGATTRQS